MTLPLPTLKNGSLFGHVFLGPSGRSPLLASDRPYLSVSVVPLTRYTVPKDTTFNLLSGGSGEVALYTNFEAQNFHHCRHPQSIISVSSRHFIKGGQTRVLEMLRRGGINYQAVRQNKVKIQGGALRIQGGASAPLCPPLNETLIIL